MTDLTPMAGGIAYGEKDWLILRFRFFKGFVTPGKPVYGVIGMLQKVRRFFLNQSICFFVISHILYQPFYLK